MPIQAPQWSDFLKCPICCREFGEPPRSPISLSCGHTLCKHCLLNLHSKQCPFDQNDVQGDPEDLPVNTALLQLVGIQPPVHPQLPPCIQGLRKQDKMAYNTIVKCLEHLALYLKLCADNTVTGSRLSRPMQRKLVTLLQCSITDAEGRSRLARSARSLGERTVTELILQHQNPQQLSANLWAAVRARGCQFLGPAMQEEVLKLVLLALEEGSALSRKVLVMFVVQSLEPHFPQASKTSIGHVVQLLYRASCFKVSKRESNSSLMQLKEEFRTYDTLRREHDAQIVQIATEAGLRIAPDQWSALLYGDAAHKSHMQSIIDKLQNPNSFAMSIQELYIALQRTGDPAQLVAISKQLHRLANIETSSEARCPTWQELKNITIAMKEVIAGFVCYIQHQATAREATNNQNNTVQDKPPESSTECQPTSQAASSTPQQTQYKTMCADSSTRPCCPGGSNCNLPYFEDEAERQGALAAVSQPATNGSYTYITPLSPGMPLTSVPPPPLPMPLPLPLYPRYSMPPPPLPHLALSHHPHLPPPMQLPHLQIEPYNVSPAAHIPSQSVPQDITHSPENSRSDSVQSRTYTPAILHNHVPMGVHGNGLIMPIPQRTYYRRYTTVMPIPEERPGNVQYARPEYVSPVYQGLGVAGCTGPTQQASEQSLPSSLPNMFVPVQYESARTLTPYAFDDLPSDHTQDYRYNLPGYVPLPACDRSLEPTWPSSNNNIFSFEGIRSVLPQCTPPSDLYSVASERLFVGADRHIATADLNNRADDQELEEELQALERRIDTEFKSTD